MLQLCGFADEIGPDLDEQIAVCQQTGVIAFELRSIGGVNVLQLDESTQRDAKRMLDDAGIGVACIGSPCGKVPVDESDEHILDMFKKAIERADFFGARLIRVFSFYPAGGEGTGPIEPVGPRAIELLQKQAELLDASGIDAVMVHENEKGIYGDIGDRCVELHQAIDHPRFRAAFDFANFVQCGENPSAVWPKLKPFVSHIHIKDAKRGSGEVVLPGEGDGGIGPILKDAYDSGYCGFLSMEPHLKVAGHSHGETGPSLWASAVAALRAVCERHDVPLAGGA